MTQIVPIFQLKTDQETIDKQQFDKFTHCNFGNGFFISPNGMIATVAHVLIKKKGWTPYVLHNDKFHRVNVISYKLTPKDENHLDVAIGQIKTSRVDFLNPLEFKKVTANSYPIIHGLSRRNFETNDKTNIQSNNYNTREIVIQTHCMDLIYPYKTETGIIIKMKYFFTLALSQEKIDLGGLSGSPVMEDNVVVGIFKGGAITGAHPKGWVLHIEELAKIIPYIPNIE